MKKVSIQKLSLLGLVLIAASAVTAAVLPSNAKTQDSDGKLVLSSNGGNTCVATNNPDDCNVSATTDTSTVQGVGDSSTDSVGSTSAGAANTTQ